LISGILGNLFSIAARLAGARGRGNEEACCKGVVELRALRKIMGNELEGTI